MSSTSACFACLFLVVLVLIENGAAIQRRCLLSPDAGQCMANVPSFAWNPSTNQCEEFVYGGCGGNGNRFDSEEECQRNCGYTFNFNK